MFYSHEVLTNKKYGVATIWLVATLGARSSTTRKVTKKAIMDVNLKKAVKTIIEPEAPMALRLQSNLLYGVTRVWTQQWDYLLHDTTAMQTAMRTFLRSAKNNDLDANAAKTRPDQLLLADDPAFLVDDSLLGPPELIFDEVDGDTQRSSQSMLSVRRRSGSVSSNRSGSAIGINLPSSSHGSYQLPDNHMFSGSSAQKGLGGPDVFNEEEPMAFGDDFDLFEFGADGGLRDITEADRQPRREGSMMPPPAKPQFGNGSIASGQGRGDNEAGFVGGNGRELDGDGNFNMLDFGDDGYLPDAEALPQASARPHLNDTPARESDVLSSSPAALAKQVRKKPKVKRFLVSDKSTIITNAEMNEWNRDYVAMQADLTMTKKHHKEAIQAKKNAWHWVFGAGLGGVGNGVGAYGLPTELAAMFSGQALYDRLRGELEVSLSSKKRTHSEISGDETGAGSSPSKRARESELGRGNDDDMIFNMDDDQQLPNNLSPEIAREAQSALADHPSSAHMPWNVSASLRAASSSIGGSRRGVPGSRRITSASPLIGRGSALPGDLERFNEGIDDMVMYGRSDNDDHDIGADGGGGISSSPNKPLPSGSSQHDDFDIFGAAAGVDTQTAGTSQWVRDALDKESNNFFEFVKNSIDEKGEDELSQDDSDAGDEKCVTFEELFDPLQNSAVVAAQAFLHVLSLATKHHVWVEQASSLDTIGREIRIGIMI